MPWVCTYHPPHAARRPFDPSKLTDIAYRVCKDFGGLPTAQAAVVGIARCEGEALFRELCSALEALTSAAETAQELIADVDTGIAIVLDVAVRFKVIDPARAAVVQGVVEALSSEAVVHALRDLGDMIGCGPFTTGGGFGGDGEPVTGGGF